jgi:gliding motility-associated-like protein
MKIFSSFFLFFLFATLVFGQSFIKSFALGDNPCNFGSISPTNENGWYASGNMWNGMALNTILTKFDSVGQILWAKKRNDYSESGQIITLKDGTLFLFTTLSYSIEYSASVMHIDLNGNILDGFVWNSPGNITSWRFACKEPTNEILAIGTWSEENSSQSSFIVKFSDNGEILWQNTFSVDLNLGYSVFSNLIPSKSGDFFAIGALNNKNSIAKFTANGNLIWSKTYDYFNKAYLISGITLPDGSLCLLGSEITSIANQNNLLLVKLNANGSFSWQKTIKSDKDLTGFKIDLLNNDTILIAASYGQQTTTNAIVVLKMSLNGDFIDKIAFGAGIQDYSNDAIFLNHQIIVCGLTETSLPQQATLSKSRLNSSCCEKNIPLVFSTLQQIPQIDTYQLIKDTISNYQINTNLLSDFIFEDSVYCQNFIYPKILDSDTIHCQGDTLLIGLISKVPVDNFHWSNGATTSNIKITTEGLYFVEINGECGTAIDSILVTFVTSDDNPDCLDSSNITIVDQQPCPFYIPNVIKSNGFYENNNLFGVFSQEIKNENFKMLIYSRWGELIFVSDNPKKMWDGYYQGKISPPGTYVYQLKMKICGQNIIKNGNFTVLN